MAIIGDYLAIKRILLLLCFVLLLGFSHGTVSAAEISQTQLQTLDSNLDKLQTIITMLKSDLKQSNSDLAKVNSELTLCLSDLQTVNQQLQQSQNEITLTKQDLTKQKELLENANLSLQKLSKEIKKLKLERDFACLGILAALFVRH